MNNGFHPAQPKFIGAIDQGTTSTRFMIFNSKGLLLVSQQEEFEQLHPHPGWHEQRTQDIITSAERCIDKGMTEFRGYGYSTSELAAVGITNQRETFVLWDRRTNEVLHNAIVWTDTRTSALVRGLKSDEGASSLSLKELQSISGLPLSTYPSAVKLMWLLREDENIHRVYMDGELMFGTIDTFLIRGLTGEFVTDSTNASRTMLMNLHKLEYDDDLFGFFDLDRKKIHLPKILPSSSKFGVIQYGPLQGVPIHGCLGDQSAALVGHLGFSPEVAKNTYGTGCFLLYNVGDRPVISEHGLIATVAYHMPLGEHRGPTYALEGSIAVAGSGVNFLSNNLSFGCPHDIDQQAMNVEDNGGVTFVTAFSGLLAPYWIDDIQGTLFGVTAHTQRGHIARATFEAVGFQTKAIVEAMEKDSGRKIDVLAVDGGMSKSDICMQIQCDITGIAVRRPKMQESTAFGAAIAAGVGVGLWTDPESELRTAEIMQMFESDWTEEMRDQKFRRWNKAVEMARGWV
ncbi:MAG: Glycerol kinase [Vezdaea aestivalis]|nr:MAG: Glycerol kinase [Vezdaea aestivalis]